MNPTLLLAQLLNGLQYGVLLFLLAAGLTWWDQHTLLGREAGITLLVVLMALKTLELRARRDALVVFFLGFFLLGIAGGDERTAGDRGRPVLSTGGAVYGDRHAEPCGSSWDLRVAGIAAGSFSDADPDRIPGSGGGTGDRAAERVAGGSGAEDDSC